MDKIKIRRLPDGPAAYQNKYWYSRRPITDVKTNSIKKGDWFTRSDYERLGNAINTNIDRILASADYKLCIQEINKVIDGTQYNI